MLRGWACVFPHLCPSGIAIAAPGKSALQKAGQEEPSGLLNHTTAQVTPQLTLATRPRLGTPDQASAHGPTGKLPVLRIRPHLLPGWAFLARNPSLMEQTQQGLLSARRYVWSSGERRLEKLLSQLKSYGAPTQTLANAHL